MSIMKVALLRGGKGLRCEALSAVTGELELSWEALCKEGDCQLLGGKEE